MSLFNFVFAFLISLFLIQLLTPVAVNVGLVDKPKGRKNHTGEVPLVGGISIFCALLISAPFFEVNFPNITLFLLSMSMVVIVGVLDDFFDLSVMFRLLVQFLVAIIFVAVGGYELSYLGSYFGTEVYLGAFAAPFTVLAVVAAINMFNMIDGIDGLLGMMATTAFAFIGVLFYLNNHIELAVVPLTMCGALVPFLLLNVFGSTKKKNKKIFMGDGGSMFMGFAVVWLLVIASQQEYHSQVISPVVALWLVAIPLMDMVAIMIRRAAKGQSPFKADREHLHHIFLRLGLSSKGALAIISLGAILLSLVGVIGQALGMSDGSLLIAFIVCFLVYYFSIRHIWRIITFIHRAFG